ncbi:unnamed protein product [Brachionus calyciflorus]|uniref:Peptidase S1 domain-containing protein n=1 Tax=Brachionus calyciflorus TaxID=104777 RepID=A0A814C177_9BILA|nr:unnamed protein product [Brachionus calyciflorus]
MPHIEIQDFNEIIFHPEYNEETLENILAIIKLSRDASLNRYIQITCLPKETSANIPESILDENGLYIAGFGSADVDPDKPKNWDRQFCAGEYNAYGNTTGVFHGDYGSALYAPYEINGKMKYVTTGILSFDVPCDVEHSPAVFTRVSYNLEWIKQNIKY